MPDTPSSADPRFMGANFGPTVPASTAINPDAPDLASAGASDAPPVATQGAFASPAKPGSLFRSVISALGLALSQGVQAGLTAPRNAQGPAVAAETAQQAPQKAFETRMANQKALTTADMDKLTIASTQLKLHQLHMITNQMEENQQNAVYDKGRDTLDKFVESGKVDILAEGDMGAVQAEFNRRQADASKQGQGLLPLQILPSLGTTGKNPKYSLVMVGKEKITDNWDETWGAKDLGYSEEDFKAAGVASFKFHASAGMDQQKALQLRATQYLNWASKAEAAMSAWKRGQATIGSREKESKANRDLRWGIAKLTDERQRTIARMRQAQSLGDKELFQALQERSRHIDKLAGIENTARGLTGWMDIGGRTQAAIKRENEAIASTDDRIAKLSGGPKVSSGSSQPESKGVATPDIVNNWSVKHGITDPKKVVEGMKKEGYTFPQKPKPQGP